MVEESRLSRKTGGLPIYIISSTIEAEFRELYSVHMYHTLPGSSWWRMIQLPMCQNQCLIRGDYFEAQHLRSSNVQAQSQVVVAKG